MANENGFSNEAVIEISGVLRQLLAGVFTLYMKTKNYHWHMTGRHFRSDHLLLDEQAEQIFAMTDDIAERARKVGGATLHSIAEISRYQRLKENEEDRLSPARMLADLRDDNSQLAGFLREAHQICGRHNDVGTTSVIEAWIDQTERRNWFLMQIASERLAG